MDIKGTITVIGETKSFGANGFTKRTCVVKTDDKYPQEIEIELTKDRTALLDGMSVGDTVSAAVNIRGRRWDGPNGAKYFVSLEAWKLERTGSGGGAVGAGADPGGDIPFASCAVSDEPR
jgi:hypothetical protein